MRLFIAASVPAEHIQAMCAAGTSLRNQRGVKPVAPEAMHLTLCFLGEREEQEVPEIISVLETVHPEAGPIASSYRGITAFPSLRRPRVIIVPVHKGAEELRNIHQALDQRLGGDSRKGFSPHITLGRVRTAESAVIRELADPGYLSSPAGEFTIDSIALYRSELLKSGARYTRLAERNLRK